MKTPEEPHEISQRATGWPPLPYKIIKILLIKFKATFKKVLSPATQYFYLDMHQNSAETNKAIILVILPSNFEYSLNYFRFFYLIKRNFM